MVNNICYICGKSCQETDHSYHSSCCISLFGSKNPPEIPYKMKELKDLAVEIINTNTAVTGVQKKLSLSLETNSRDSKLTFVGLWGNYILKPPVANYNQLPENEFLTMCMADVLGIQTVPHALLPMASGELAYVTKRIDRTPSGKIHMEDMAQICERMTEDKYRGSVEQIAKVILQNCENRIFDAIRFYELVFFSFLSGNSDMHLKNYSLIYEEDGIRLSPAYDLLNTRLIISELEDPEESALAINGKRRKLNKNDFLSFSQKLQLTRKQLDNIHLRFDKKKEELITLINTSLLSKEMREEYKSLLLKRFQIIK